MMPLEVWPDTALDGNHQSICMPQLLPLCSAALVPNVLPRRDEGLGIIIIIKQDYETPIKTGCLKGAHSA